MLVNVEVIKVDVIRVDLDRHAEMRAVVQSAVVRITNNDSVSALAAQKNVVLGMEVDDFRVNSVVYVDCRWRGVVGRQRIERALHGGKVPAVILGDEYVGGIGRAAGFGGELPDIGGGDAGKICAVGVGKDPVIYSDIIGMVRSQDFGVRIDGGLIAGDDNRIGGKVLTADGPGLERALSHVNRVHGRSRIRVVIDVDFPNCVHHRGAVEGNIQGRVIANTGLIVSGRKGDDRHGGVDCQCGIAAGDRAGGVGNDHEIRGGVGGRRAGDGKDRVGGVGNGVGDGVLIPLVSRRRDTAREDGERGALVFGDNQADGLVRNRRRNDDGKDGAVGLIAAIVGGDQ